MPVPDSVTLLVAPAALWLTVTLPLRGPAAAGVKPTETLQLAPAAIVPQLLIMENSELLVATELTTRLAVPVLVMANCCRLALLPTGVAGKASEPGDTCASGVPPAAVGLPM